MDITSITDFIFNLVLILSTVIGGASMIVAGLRKIAKITPTEKDDAFLSKADNFLNKAMVIIDKLALNPPEEKARRVQQK